MKFYDLVATELPLVLFTTFFQAVVGLIFVYTPAFIKGYKSQNELKNFGLFSFFALFFALLPSIFHLGDITHVFSFLKKLVMFKLNGEWHINYMNNEVMCAGISLIFALLLYLKTNRNFLFLSLFFGLLCIFFMAGAYGSMQESVTTWRFDITLFYFYSSALFLGGIFYHLVFAKDIYEEKMAFLVGLFGIGILITSIVFQTLHLGNVVVAGVINPFDLLNGNYGNFILASAVLIGLAMLLWYFNNYLNKKNKALAFVAFLVALLGVMISRIIFYGLINTHIMH